MTSQWTQYRLKSPASRFFTQPSIQTQIKESIKAPRHWPFCGEFTVDRWIPRAIGQQRGKCFHLMTSSWLRPRDGHHTRICYHWFRRRLVASSVLTEVSTNIALSYVSSGSSLPNRKQIIYFNSIKFVQNAVFPWSVIPFKGHRVLHHTIFQLSVNLWFKQMNTTYRALSYWRCRKHFSQWQRSFQWKLRAHCLKFLQAQECVAQCVLDISW